MDLVSFLIAAYNEEKFISECIDSCLNQTYKNIEICIVDDGSTDKTWDIILNYEKYRVVCYKFMENRGKIAAFNKAFELSSGEYLAIMGADDICHKDRIEISIKKISNYNLIFGNLRSKNETGIISNNIMQDKFNIKEDSEFVFSELLIKPVVYGGTVFAKRDSFNKIFPIDENLSHEDWWVPLIISFNSPIKYINHIMIDYRMHDKQTSCSFERKIGYKKWLSLKTRELSFYEKIKKDIDLPEKEIIFVYREIIKIILHKQNNIIDRFCTLYSYLKKDMNLLSKEIAILSIVGSRASFYLYKIRFYATKWFL